MLRLDLAQEPRLLEIEANTRQRLGEAQQMQWLGEVVGVQESLRHIADKNSRASVCEPKPIKARTSLPWADLDGRTLLPDAALIVVRLCRQDGPGAFVGQHHQAYGHVP